MSGKAEDNFLAALREQIASEQMLDAGDRVLLAVSGGCDSMAMLYGLVQLGQESAGAWG